MATRGSLELAGVGYSDHHAQKRILADKRYMKLDSRCTFSSVGAGHGHQCSQPGQRVNYTGFNSFLWRIKS